MLSIRESSWNIKIRALTRLSEKGPNYPPSPSQVFWMTLMCILLPACIWLFEGKGNQKLLLFCVELSELLTRADFLWVWLYLNNRQTCRVRYLLLPTRVWATPPAQKRAWRICRMTAPGSWRSPWKVSQSPPAPSVPTPAPV